jgi:hypothetical protein
MDDAKKQKMAEEESRPSVNEVNVINSHAMKTAIRESILDGVEFIPVTKLESESIAEEIKGLTEPFHFTRGYAPNETPSGPVNRWREADARVAKFLSERKGAE